MAQVAFWFAWFVVGLSTGASWLGRACPSGGCNGMLVAIQFFQVIVPLALWLGVGIAGSYFLASLQRPAGNEATSQARGTLETGASHEAAAETGSDEDEMAKYGIVFEGKQYRFREHRYDRVEDAIAYAKLVEKRRAV